VPRVLPWLSPAQREVMICVKDVRGYARRLPRLPPGAGMNRFILARRSAYPAADEAGSMIH